MPTPIKMLGFETRSAWNAGTSLSKNPNNIVNPDLVTGSQGGTSVALRLQSRSADDSTNGDGLNVDWDLESNLTHFIAHIRFNSTGISTRDQSLNSESWLIALRNSSNTIQYAVHLEPDGTLRGTTDTDGDPSTYDGSGTIVEIVDGNWYTMELEVITGGSGKIHCKINGLTMFEHSITTLDATGLSKIAMCSGFDSAETVNGACTTLFDDLFVYTPDSTGGFLGGYNIYESMPTSDATASAWTKSSDGSAGDIYTMIDETTEGSDGDTTYGTTETIGAKALFNLTYPKALEGDIRQIEYENTIRHETAEKNWIPHRVTNGSPVDDGTSLATSASYQTNKQIVNVNIPNADANGTVFGIRRLD